MVERLEINAHSVLVHATQPRRIFKLTLRVQIVAGAYCNDKFW